MTIVPLPYEIAHCSAWDDDHGPEQLVASSPGNRNRSDNDDESFDLADADELPSNNKVKGWQTPKCPNYPQDLIIHLLCGPARIAKVQVLSHHYKIATKIDVYIGVLKDPHDVIDDSARQITDGMEDDEDDMIIEFTRLGYVCLDNNTRAQFRARELKSIKVNADGEYIRLVVRNCHRNRLNTYNQVGLLALNILGQPLRNSHGTISAIPSHMSRHLQHPLDETSMLSCSTRRTSVSSNHSLVNRLSGPGAVEIELQQWVSALIHAEEEAVRDESYQLAKTYKQLSDKLSRFVKILIDLEISKKQAAESKDYDEAEKIKADINEIKQSAELLLRQANIHVTRDGRIVSNGCEPFEDNGSAIIPPSLRTYNRFDSGYSDGSRYDREDSTLVNYAQTAPDEHQQEQQDRLYDEAIAKWTNFDANTIPPNMEDPSQNDSLTHRSSPTSSLSTDAAEMLLPPHLTSYGHDSAPLVGRDILESSMDKSFDMHRGSLASMMAPSLSSSVAKKHSLRGSIAGLPVAEQEMVEEEKEQEELLDPDSIPEPLIDAERTNCAIPIRVFGEDIVACVLSVKAKCRERGLNYVASRVKAACSLSEENQLQRIGELMVDDGDIPDDSSVDSEEDGDEDSRTVARFIKASLMMLQEAVMDSRESIISMTIDIWNDLNELCDTVPHTMIFGLIERAFSGLLMRTNESNSRIRQAATELVLQLAHKFHEAPYSLLSLFIGKPDRIIHNHKDARARIDLVTSAVSQLGVRKPGDSASGIIYLDDLMDFVVAYVRHSHEDVRQAAVELLIDASDQVGFKTVSKYIDDDLRVSLTETVKKVAEQRNKTTSKKTTASNNAMAELRALAAQASIPAEKKSSSGASGRKTADSTKRRVADKKQTAAKADSRSESRAATTKKPASSGATTRAKATKTTTTKTTTTKTNGAGAQAQDPPSTDKNMCIFCEEVNPNFNEETLISHYYDECPMLTSCPRCQTILEISTLNDHNFTDCAKRHLVKQCTRCKQPIPVEQWLQHTLKKTCTAITDPQAHCPLCLVVIDPPTESEWKAHLLSGNGCPKNPRPLRKPATAANAKSGVSTTATTTTTATEEKKRPTATAGRRENGTTRANSSLRRKK